MIIGIGFIAAGIALSCILYIVICNYKVSHTNQDAIVSLKSLRLGDLKEAKQNACELIVISENDTGVRISAIENNLVLTIQRTCAQRGHAYKCYASSSVDIVHPHTLEEKPVVTYYFQCSACNHARSKTENDLTIGEVRLCLDGRFALPKKLLKKKRYKVAQIKELAAQGLVLDR